LDTIPKVQETKKINKEKPDFVKIKKFYVSKHNIQRVKKWQLTE
jgi:hypothetical protein